MQITRQADYAVRAILHLASIKPGDRAPTSQIARKQGIPPSFLAKIVSQLSVAGIVQTSRGARGGVSLAKTSVEICLREVIEAIDGPILLNECVSNPDNCPYSGNCPVHGIWQEAQNDLIKRLSSTTFAQLTEQYTLDT